MSGNLLKIATTTRKWLKMVVFTSFLLALILSLMRCEGGLLVDPPFLLLVKYLLRLEGKKAEGVSCSAKKLLVSQLKVLPCLLILLPTRLQITSVRAMNGLESGVTIATSHAILVKLVGKFMANLPIGRAVSKEKRAN